MYCEIAIIRTGRYKNVRHMSKASCCITYCKNRTGLVMENKSASSGSSLLRPFFLSLTVLSCLLISIAFLAPAQNAHAATSSYTLTINNLDSALPQDFIPRVQGVFDFSYPLLVHRFGSDSTTKNVTLVIDPTADGVAWASND